MFGKTISALKARSLLGGLVVVLLFLEDSECAKHGLRSNQPSIRPHLNKDHAYWFCWLPGSGCCFCDLDRAELYDVEAVRKLLPYDFIRVQAASHLVVPRRIA